MFKKLIQSFKDEIHLKSILLWFSLSFIGVLLVYVFIANETLDGALLIQTFGFAIVFVLMMLGTKVYGNFINGYYQKQIDRQNKKYKNKNKNKKTKRSQKRSRIKKG